MGQTIPNGPAVNVKMKHKLLQTFPAHPVTKVNVLWINVYVWNQLLQKWYAAPLKICWGKANMQNFQELSKNFFIDSDFIEAFTAMGLTGIDAVFKFDAGQNLAKENLAEHRTRIKFEIDQPGTTLFLKRYNTTPKPTQLKNWFANRKRAAAMHYDLAPAQKLLELGINAPKTICYGSEWAGAFEKRSFIITENIPNAQSLESRLPDIRKKKHLIDSLAEFVRKFHGTGSRHRDLYLCHIFYSDKGDFTLIDLHRCLRPRFLAERFRLKDIAQLYYSAPGKLISGTDRLRFYLRYAGIRTLSKQDKLFIAKLKAKANKMAKHDIKHGRGVPFAS